MICWISFSVYCRLRVKQVQYFFSAFTQKRVPKHPLKKYISCTEQRFCLALREIKSCFFCKVCKALVAERSQCACGKLQCYKTILFCVPNTLFLQVGKLALLGFDIGVRNTVRYIGTLFCKLTNSCHGTPQK